jgi:hypothetical protein
MKRIHIMAIKKITVKYTGFAPLLQNNPRGINPLDPLLKIDAAANKKYKASKTDENFEEQIRTGINLRIFYDDDLKVYIPTRWILAQIAKHSFKRAKISKDNARAAVFTITDKAKLYYDGDDLVKEREDIFMNDKFQTIIFQKIGQVKVPKSMPIFHKWSFETELEFDNTIIDFEQLKDILVYAAKYNGFGDFRPTYGRCTAEVTLND